MNFIHEKPADFSLLFYPFFGGSISPEWVGHFKPEQVGQFKPEQVGQFHRNLQLECKIT